MSPIIFILCFLTFSRFCKGHVISSLEENKSLVLEIEEIRELNVCKHKNLLVESNFYKSNFIKTLKGMT